MYSSVFWRKTSVTAALACTVAAPLFVSPAFAAPQPRPTQSVPTQPSAAESVPAGVSGYDGEVPTHSDENIDADRIQVSAAAAADPIADMDKVASNWGFGAATSAKIGIGSGYWVKFFQQGTVVYSPGKGSVPMANEVYQRWIHETREGWGQPLYSERIDRGIKTYFSNGAYVLDTNSGLIMRADQHIGAGDILTIGDSQVWRDSWVGKGIKDAGYTPWFYRCGGTGMVASRPDTGCRKDYADGTYTYSNGTPTPISGDINYFKGVVENRWLLPDGAPRAIYIQGSGNDAGKSFAEVSSNARQIVQKLRKAYPGTQIILTDPLSQNIPDHAARAALAENLRKFAQEENLTFISYKYWVSDYQVQGGLEDALHFADKNQYLLAPHMRDSLQAALRGFTLKGGVGQFHADNLGTSRFGVPVSNEIALQDGGVYQAFSNRYSIYWTPRESAHSVKFSRALGQAYKNAGYERTSGYPYMEETSIPGGAMQKFRDANGQVSAFYWSPAFGAYKVWEGGAIGSRFTRDGGTATYGFPTENETAFENGTRQVFNLDGKETRMYWAPNTGAHVMNGNGSIFKKWVSLGHAPNMGFPVTEEISAGNGGAVQYTRTADNREFGFFWSASTGTHVMNSKGALYYHFINNGYTSTFGYPVEDEHVETDGRIHVKFSKGQELTWSASEGVRVH